MGDIIDWLRKCGPVVYPLLSFSVIALALMIERWLFWWKVTHRQEAVVRECLALYPRNPRAALFKLEQNADLPIARIFLSALEVESATPEEFRLALEAATYAEIPLLKRFTTVFDTIITLAPFLGLLGTVTGIIQILRGLRIGEAVAAGAVGVEQGISEALHSTALGLYVAIPTLIISNVFRSLYVRQMSKVQEYGGQLELIHRLRLESPVATAPITESIHSGPRRELHQ